MTKAKTANTLVYDLLKANPKIYKQYKKLRREAADRRKAHIARWGQPLREVVKKKR